MAAKNTNVARNGLQVSTFYVGPYFFGIDVVRIQEVLRSQPMTMVPLAPAVVEGLINLRGQIVPAIDMRRRLHLHPRAAEASSMNVVVRTDDGLVSLIVDDIGDVIDLDPGNIEQPPDNLAPEAGEIIESIYKMRDSLLLLLNADSTVQIAFPPVGNAVI